MKKASYGNRIFSFDGDNKDFYFSTCIPETLTQDEVFSIAGLLIKNNDCVIDVGANIGVSTCVFASLVSKGKVFAFEPEKRNFQFLKNNCHINALPNVQPIQAALGNSVGEIQFFAPKEFGAGSFISNKDSLAAQRHSEDITKVACTTLDRIADEHRIEKINFIKIDVEGHELGVLEGATEVLKAHKPIVLMEFNSYAMVAHASVLPTAVLEKVFQLFPFVYVLNPQATFQALTSIEERHAFLHRNMTKGCVDNLLCSFNPIVSNPLLDELKQKIRHLESKVCNPRWNRVWSRMKKLCLSENRSRMIERFFE